LVVVEQVNLATLLVLKEPTQLLIQTSSLLVAVEAVTGQLTTLLQPLEDRVVAVLEVMVQLEE
jgi:hypothetical protein